MKDPPPLETLSDEEKNALIKLLWQEQQRLRAEVEKLTQKRVKKTSRNSGLPPSKGLKPNQLSQAQGTIRREGSIGRAGGGRNLSADPDQVVERVRSTRLVCRDDTSAWVDGKTQGEGVFQNEQVCLQGIRPSRGKQVIEEVMGDHRPQIWVSDLFSAQKANPTVQWQVCLAHQLRDCQDAINAGDNLFAATGNACF